MTDLVIPAAIIATTIVFAVVLVIINDRRRHAEIVRLLNDLATMLGEMFDKKE